MDLIEVVILSLTGPAIIEEKTVIPSPAVGEARSCCRALVVRPAGFHSAIVAYSTSTYSTGGSSAVRDQC